MPDQTSDEKEKLIDSMIAKAFWINKSKRQELLDSSFDLKEDWYKQTKKVISIWAALLIILLFTWMNNS